MDSFHQVITSFQNFERKLDKLQDDVSSHGYTLCELRCLMADLTAGKATTSASKNDPKKWPKKTIAVQYENEANDGPLKPKRITMKPMASKVKSRVAKPIARFPREHTDHYPLKEGLNTKGVMGVKYPAKPRKAEAPKKPANMRDHRFENKLKKKDGLPASS